MAKDTHSHHPVPAAAGYETTDANIKQISVWTIGIFVTIFAGMLGMLGLIIGFIKFPVELDRKPTSAEIQRTLPPTPRLQVNQTGDLTEFRAREEAAANSWRRDPNSGAVQIPVDKAIEIIAGRGVLPGSRPVAAAVAAAAKPEPKGGAAARK